MSEPTQDRINRYLQDVTSAEQNFEVALRSFSEAGEQSAVQQLMQKASARAKTQHERLESLLSARGLTPSKSKTLLAELLAFSPLSAQLGQSPEAKNVQHLIVTFGAAGAETAMYESLIASAEAGRAAEVVSLARELQEEERDDARQVWKILADSARSAYESELAKSADAKEVLGAYLEDVIASEKAFQMQLESFASAASDPRVKALYETHAKETQTQYEELTAHLKQIGGSPSILKSFLSHTFGVAPKLAQLGHDAAERETQNLMMAFAVENAEVAMYESLATAAESAGDAELATLARKIQRQEKEMSEKLWPWISESARIAVTSI